MKGFPSAKVKPEPASQVKSARSSVTTMFSVGKFSPSMSGHTGPIYERRQERNNNNECCQCSLPVNKINIKIINCYTFPSWTTNIPEAHVLCHRDIYSRTRTRPRNYLFHQNTYHIHIYIYIYMMNSQCMLWWKHCILSIYRHCLEYTYFTMVGDRSKMKKTNKKTSLLKELLKLNTKAPPYWPFFVREIQIQQCNYFFTPMEEGVRWGFQLILSYQLTFTRGYVAGPCAFDRTVTAPYLALIMELIAWITLNGHMLSRD